MTWWEAINLGLIEGITEYLPISSTGHLVLCSALLGLDSTPELKKAVDSFNVIIQGGGILAVLALFRGRVVQMVQGLLGRDRIGLRMLGNLAVAFAPAAIIGLLLVEWIEANLFKPVPVIIALGGGGVVLILLSSWQRRFFHEVPEGEHDPHTYVDIDQLTWRRALIIGLMQCLALWPGTSRSMMTIIGGMVVGLRPKQAAEFSFLLALPTLGGACIYKASSFDRDMLETLGVVPIIIGLVVATVSALLSVRWLVGYLSRHGVAVFGWYRMALAGLLVTLILAFDIPRIGTEPRSLRHADPTQLEDPKERPETDGLMAAPTTHPAPPGDFASVDSDR